MAEKPHDAVLKFDTHRNYLQPHRAVLLAIARLSCEEISKHYYGCFTSQLGRTDLWSVLMNILLHCNRPITIIVITSILYVKKVYMKANRFQFTLAVNSDIVARLNYRLQCGLH